MTRADLQALALVRLEEAKALLAAGFPSGAYYLAGYSVECAFKAVIARQTQQHEFPDKQRAIDSFVHDLVRLSRVARVDELLTAASGSNRLLERNWDFAKGWSPDSRYAQIHRSTAEAMLKAVSEETNGVLPWIMQYW